MKVPVRDAAKLTCLPVRTVYQWVKEGRLTVAYTAQGLRVDLSEVAELAKTRGSGRLPRKDRRCT